MQIYLSNAKAICQNLLAVGACHYPLFYYAGANSAEIK
jgi:hypothetical protein